jgi:hypothetical protein
MKNLSLLICLFYFTEITAQNVAEPDKLTNTFILPIYSNTILDAEHFFTINEMNQLNRSIDSVLVNNKLQLQFAFVTEDYFENDTTKFFKYVDTLTSKWNPGNSISRILLIVCMQQGQAELKFSGDKLTISNLFNAIKEKREFTQAEKDVFENFDEQSTEIIGQSNLGLNLKAKNYLQAVNEFIKVIVTKQYSFFNL